MPKSRAKTARLRPDFGRLLLEHGSCRGPGVSAVLVLDRIQRVLLAEPAGAAPVVESGVALPHGAGASALPIPAAILFPIILREQPTVLLTQRTAHLRDHPGQISFPGGRIEAGDASPLMAALRETEEEIGLSRQHVSLMGYLPQYVTGTGFVVTPVVSIVKPPFALQADAFEVAEIFEVPLAVFLESSNYQSMTLHGQGRARSFYAIPYQHRFIWGATAGMIRSLFERFHHQSSDDLQAFP